MKTTYDYITEARKTLELPESATMKNIRENYRRLLKQWHPDKSIIHTDIDSIRNKEARTNEIIRAYKTIPPIVQIIAIHLNWRKLKNT